ncbi:GTA-gp10 family protein [Parasedimentitalea psychrophila]|uniref:GTA-gp10 family protein n=1 Tax=Parasedimentitalea psychrophila TaxID=2997337 RepID=A0A9Y2KWX4_9RHOB|nr:GTA-gp10 family protein [Parasedimentitalea psychrophila]WIY23352.1 GTA-gp10 family protein [Parasedimentitalea psychrophila]
MANRFKGEVSITIDGKVWTLVCDFNAMAEFEEATGMDAMAAFEKAEGGEVSIADLRHMVHAFLKLHHPEATLRDAGNVMSEDVAIVASVLAAASPTAAEAGDLGNAQTSGNRTG